MLESSGEEKVALEVFLAHSLLFSEMALVAGFRQWTLP
jgi:hypothetical protein